eukprot:114526_1
MSIITLDNVHSLSTYELRQEVEKRVALEGVDSPINHTNLMKKVVSVLFEEKLEHERMLEVKLEKARMEKCDGLKLERERRKQEMVERSKARKESEGYFENKKKANVAPPSRAAIETLNSGDDIDEIDEYDECGGRWASTSKHRRFKVHCR